MNDAAFNFAQLLHNMPLNLTQDLVLRWQWPSRQVACLAILSSCVKCGSGKWTGQAHGTHVVIGAGLMHHRSVKERTGHPRAAGSGGTATPEEVNRLLSSIDRELEPWRQAGVTLEMVERAYCLEAMTEGMRVQVCSHFSTSLQLQTELADASASSPSSARARIEHLHYRAQSALLCTYSTDSLHNHAV